MRTDTLFSAVTGTKRRKITRTSYTDKGEEITEEVWEEDTANEDKNRAGSAVPSGGKDSLLYLKVIVVDAPPCPCMTYIFFCRCVRSTGGKGVSK